LEVIPNSSLPLSVMSEKSPQLLLLLRVFQLLPSLVEYSNLVELVGQMRMSSFPVLII
jgi:hypothetical protein